MVVTFTNKAADEIKGRITCANKDQMWIGTFHSICLKIIIKFGHLLNIKGFNIMDNNSRIKSIKNVMKDIIDDKDYLYDKNGKISQKLFKQVESLISKNKNNFVSSIHYYDKYKDLSKDYNKFLYYFCRIYNEYCSRNFRNKLFDFDDLLVYGCLLSRNDSVRDYFRSFVHWYNVDEAQDTNKVQYDIITNLAGANNIFLVGDDSQSIYGFRSAKPEYLLNFKNNFPNGQILSLDRNYRSTKNIVDASTALINHNTDMFKKKCYSENEEGDKILVINHPTPVSQAEWYCSTIEQFINQGYKYSDIAILYRTGKQERVIEETMVKFSIPHKVVGDLGFYDRKVIKDVLAYLFFSSNKNDDISFSRAISLFPGIGATSITKCVENAKVCNIDLLESAKLTFTSKKQIIGLNKFINIIQSVEDLQPNEMIIEIWNAICDYSRTSDKSEKVKEENELVEELVNSSMEFESNNPNCTLQQYLNNVLLLSQNKNNDEDADVVSLMTIHSAKGLEFKIVIVSDVAEGILPHDMSLKEGGKEEERRLMYEAMTRAEEKLILSYSGIKSCFLDEIPKQYIESLEV